MALATPVKALLAVPETMSGWPISTSAGTWLVVGMEFHINTRL